MMMSGTYHIFRTRVKESFKQSNSQGWISLTICTSNWKKYNTFSNSRFNAIFNILLVWLDIIQFQI